MRSYENLSSGEKTLFSQFVNLFTAIIESKQKEYVLFLDEPDNTLHPQWQKEYINLLLEFLKANFQDKIFHCIITSHSPFLLSDIPKQNIIFLDKEENGNCKVLNHDEVLSKKQTFGANIHTLLSDSFFMEDGLMGEFAKNKIQEIMDFLNNIKTIEKISTKEEHIKQVIESIGEPFLKQKLLDMYYTKYKDESLKEARKKELEAQKRQIEEELKRL